MLIGMLPTLVLVGLVVAAPPAGRTSKVAFEIRTKHNEGPVRCGLYDKARTWLSRRYAFNATATSQAGRATCIFEDVPAGRYAAVAYHDKNDNGELDRNLLGLPAEDFAFSQGAKAGLGPPSFDDAAFEIRGEPVLTRGSM